MSARFRQILVAGWKEKREGAAQTQVISLPQHLACPSLPPRSAAVRLPTAFSPSPPSPSHHLLTFILTSLVVGGGGSRKPALTSCWFKCKLRQLLRCTPWHQTLKYKAVSPRTHPQEKLALLHAASLLLNEALFEGEKTWKRPKPPSIGGWLSKP